MITKDNHYYTCNNYNKLTIKINWWNRKMARSEAGSPPASAEGELKPEKEPMSVVVIGGTGAERKGGGTKRKRPI